MIFNVPLELPVILLNLTKMIFFLSSDAKYQNRRTMSSSDRTLIAAFKEISQMADRINLPKTIVDRANKLFKQVHDGKNLRGRSNDAKASACLYIACRQEGVPRTFKEICAVSKISKKEIGRCFKLTLKALATSVDLITTADFMSRFCANLGNLRNYNSVHISSYLMFTNECSTRLIMQIGHHAKPIENRWNQSIYICLFVYVYRFTYCRSTSCHPCCTKSSRNGYCTGSFADFSGSRRHLHRITGIRSKA